ncbi:DivIVA domain-containing protein [Parafrankia sp. BMG5.11]|uniref:DivIVA domain-containing protein n=1 Tax=Parafrankia sp. BMG5.11 TaxID=222540 RepID=UPI00103AFF1A|nr:ATP synthase F0 subunit B [Parafrankia sp. BMG5.11]TCJ33065.1 hypothetical protein E0504_39490 [Parafrankia sp. BMG5.11]
MGAHHRRESPGAAMDRPTFDEAPQGYDPRQVDEYLGVLWRYASEVTSRAAAAEAALRHERDRREAEARLAEGLPAQAGGRIGLMLEIAQREAEDIIAGARHLAESALEEAVAQAGANHPIVREAREQAEKLILDAVEESRRLALTRHEDLEAEIVRGTHSLEALRRQQGEIIGAVLRLRRLLGGDEIDRAVTDLARAGVSPDGVAADSGLDGRRGGRADAGAPAGPNLAGAPSVDSSAAPFTPGRPAAGPGHPAAPEQPGPPGQPGSQPQPGGAASSLHFPASDHAGHTGGVDSTGDPLRGPGGTGHAGTGQAGGVGPGGSAYAAAGYAAGHAAASPAGTGHLGTGHTSAGHAGTGHTGTSHLGAGSVGAGSVGAGHVGAGHVGASRAGATSSGGSTGGTWAASSRLTAETGPAAPSAAATVGSATVGARRGPGRHRQQQRDVPEAEPYPTDLAGGFVPGGPAAGGAGTGPVRMPAAGYRPAAEEDILDAEIVEE